MSGNELSLSLHVSSANSHCGR